MPIKDWTAGERPSAADLNRYFMQQAHVIKPTDTTITSSTTMADDPHLFLSVQAGTDYWVQAIIIYNASSAADIKISFSGPGGATFDWVSDSLGSTIAAGSGAVDIISRSLQGLGSTPAPGGAEQPAGTRIDAVSVPKGILRIGANSGTLRFRWAQLASGSPGSIVRAGSTLMMRRLTT